MFGRTGHMSAIIEILNEGVKYLKSDRCSKPFGQQINLKAHIIAFHERLEMFNAKIAPKALGRLNLSQNQIKKNREKTKDS